MPSEAENAVNGSPTTTVVPGAIPEVFYPSSDGEPMAETEAHLLVMLTLITTLRLRYADRPEVYVIGNMFLYYEEGNSQARKAPDVMVVKNVEPKEHRLSFKIWEEGAGPSVIFEITSKGTADEDEQEKRELYQRLGVKEYFLFDPLNEYLQPQLKGYVLIGDAYEPIQPAADGGLLSNQLQVRLVPEGKQLVLYDFATGERLPTPPETQQLWREAQRQVEELRLRIEKEEARADEAQRQAKQQRERADKAELQAKEQRDRAEEAERRANELAAEIARLRAQQPPSQPNGPSADPG